ncbi:xanthine dehydrogenase family protein molybdopterin-binding subunit [Chthonobacter rhizosphaerae]|uniref:xanthine dehydrogenase family protein molybdopterin-binding subunit n=1 Tax=Chthonobacter rhizosphaerae TaxID=2735553 RepID=UPI0015EFACD6|nr:xanthine dehydrogenase family protein molybdopterin-binding subunit [Chthonobacter rhizosphaerae]
MTKTPAFGLVDAARTAAISRRQALMGGGMMLAFLAVGRRKAHAAGEEPSLRAIGDGTIDTGDAFEGFAPGGFIRIGRDNAIHLIVPNVEMGQGIYTAEAMLIAEELEVGLDQVTVLAAPPNEELYKQPILQSQTTGGSTSIRGAFEPLRQAGAAARMMLIAAAAERMKAPAGSLRAERGRVIDPATGEGFSYGELVDDAAKMPVPQDVPLKPKADWRLIGTPARRVESAGKVNGTATFGIDIKVEGMKVATVKASPTVGGKLKRVDDTAARAIPGVVDVIRIENAVAVVGDHFWAANQGLQALDIEWDPGENAGLDTAALRQALATASQSGTPILGRQEGDAAAAMAGAARRVEATYELPFLAHAALEPINTTIHVTEDGCDIWVGTQVPTAAQKVAADRLGLPLDKVRLHNQVIGGGFGRRLVADSIEQAALIGKQVRYPVKIIWTREEDITQDLYRPAYYDRISAGLDQNNRPVAFMDRITGGSVLGAYLPGGLPEGTIDSDAIEGAADTPYGFPTLLVDWIRADPPVPVTWWRGVGPTHNVFVVESFMDELAEAAGEDPVDFRMSLLKEKPRAAAVLRLAAERSGWGGDLPPRHGRGVSLHGAFGSFVAVVLEASVGEDGAVKLHRAVAAVDCGMVVNPDTVKAQIEGGLVFGLSAALYNGITFANGQVEQSNFDTYPQMRINEVPPIEVHIIESDAAPGGIGETGTVSAAPSLVNAIFQATGKRIRTLPLSGVDLGERDAGLPPRRDRVPA